MHMHTVCMHGTRAMHASERAKLLSFWVGSLFASQVPTSVRLCQGRASRAPVTRDDQCRPDLTLLRVRATHFSRHKTHFLRQRRPRMHDSTTHDKRISKPEHALDRGLKPMEQLRTVERQLPVGAHVVPCKTSGAYADSIC